MRWSLDHYQACIAKLKTVADALPAPEPPDRPYDRPDADACRFCPYRDHCWDGANQESDLPAGYRRVDGNGYPTTLNDPELNQAAADWIQAKTAQDRSREPLEKAYRQARDKNPDTERLRIGPVNISEFRPADRVSYDENKLAEKLTAAELRACRRETEPPRVWIRVASRRR